MNIKLDILSFPKQDGFEQLANVLEPANNQEYNDFNHRNSFGYEDMFIHEYFLTIRKTYTT